MDTQQLVAELDKEIAKLKEARALLAGTSTHTAHTAKSTGKKRTLSAEARKKIADAQKKRWAKVKKAAK